MFRSRNWPRSGVVNHLFGKATGLAQFSLSGPKKGYEAEAADRAHPKARSPFMV